MCIHDFCCCFFHRLCLRKGNLSRSYMYQCPGGGGGGTLIFSHMRRLGIFFGVQKIWISIFFGVFRKMNFWGVWRFCGYFLGGHLKIDLVLRPFLCILGSFLRSKYRIGIFFGVAKIPKFFRGAWNSWYFLGSNGRCWVRAYVCGKNKSTPPGYQCSSVWGNCHLSFVASLVKRVFHLANGRTYWIVCTSIVLVQSQRENQS